MTKNNFWPSKSELYTEMLLITILKYEDGGKWARSPFCGKGNLFSPETASSGVLFKSV